MGKSITIISLNYYPEDTAIGLYSTQMAEYLQQNNWKVTVITGFPYYPKWEISKDYKNKNKYLEETINGIQILRYKQFVPSDPKFLNRIIHIIDFTTGSVSNIKKIKKSDVILSIIPFTSTAWLGKKLSKKLNAKHWIHIQDFEFDIALNSGIVPSKRLNKIITKKLFQIESKLLDSADIVSTISNRMLDKLENKCSTKSYYFPNWVDAAKINPELATQHTYLKSNKFKVLYAGNIGEKQDWKLFIKIVQHFKNDNRIEFIIVGDGSFKKKLVNHTADFSNIKFFDSVPFKELNNLLCAANLHILFQKDDIIDSVMPSKLLGMLASEVPCLISGNINSEITKIIQFKKIGFFFNSSDIQNLLKTIDDLITTKKSNGEIGKNARNYVINLYDKERILKLFNQKLNQLNAHQK